MSFVSNRRGVEVRGFHDKTSHAFPSSIELSVYTTFGLCDGSKNFDYLFSVSCEDFVLTRIRLNPLSSKILYHDSGPVIVSRFTSLIEDFVICRYQVTNFSARTPTLSIRLLQGALVILVLKQTSQSRSFGKREKI